MSDIRDWLPTDTFRGVEHPSTTNIDNRLSGIRFPPPLCELRRLAARPITPERWFDDNMQNMLTRSAQRSVYAFESINTWENEGGR